MEKHTFCYCGLLLGEDDVLYCKECKERKIDFLKQVIDDVHYDVGDSYLGFLVSMLDDLRKMALMETISDMIDDYYERMKIEKGFTEPYDNPGFLENVYRAKQLLLETFLNGITKDCYVDLAKDTSGLFWGYRDMVRESLVKTTKTLENDYGLKKTVSNS